MNPLKETTVTNGRDKSFSTISARVYGLKNHHFGNETKSLALVLKNFRDFFLKTYNDQDATPNSSMAYPKPQTKPDPI